MNDPRLSAVIRQILLAAACLPLSISAAFAVPSPVGPLPVPSSAVGVPGGVAPLDSSANVPAANLHNMSAAPFVATCTPAAGTVAGRLAQRINVKDCGAQENYVAGTTGVATANATAFSASGGSWTSADVGKPIWVAGAGAAGAVFVTTISQVNSPTSINFATPALTSANPTNYGYGTDDTAAWAAAISAANASMALGGYPCVYEPGGASFVNGASLPIFVGPGCVIGDGHAKSYIALGPSYTGDTFSWSESWEGPNWANTAPGASIGASKAGPVARGFGIIGNRLSTGQNGLVFYDRNDVVDIFDVDASYLPGRALYSGAVKNTGIGAMRESHIDAFRSFSSGQISGTPAVEFWSQGNSFSSNEIAIGNMEIYGSYGAGLYMHTDATGSNLGGISFDRLRIEGIENNPVGATGDLLTLGSPTAAGVVAGISFNHLELLDSYSGYCSMRITGGTGALTPFFITVLDGATSGGAGGGNGLCIYSGRDIFTHWTGMNTTGPEVVIGPVSGGVSSPIVIDGGGAAQTWTWSIDASVSPGTLLHNAFASGDPTGNGTLGFSLELPDGTTLGGNQRGLGAIDMQTFRNTSTQIAAGAHSVIIGGIENTVAGGQAAVVGGTLNQLGGTDSFAGGGQQAADRSRVAMNCFSSGAVVTATAGSAQKCEEQFRNNTNGSAAVRMFADGTSAATAFNCLNIGDNTHYSVTASLSAVDRSNPTKTINVVGWQIDMLRQTGAASTAVRSATQPAALTNGATTGWSLTAAADTTTGCLNLSFTAPTGNLDLWDFVANLTSLEIQ